MHVRIQLEKADGGRIKIEAGETAFRNNPWRMTVTTGHGDNRTVLSEEQYSTEEALSDTVDATYKQYVKHGWKLAMFKADGMDIDWLHGVNLPDETE